MDDPSSLPERLSALPDRLSVVFKPRRFRKAARWTGTILGVTTVFLTSTVAGVILHLGTREGRAVVRESVNALLAPVFDGRLDIGEIEELSFDHARVRSASIYDPNGLKVIEAEDIEGRISTLTLLRDLWSGEGPLRIVIPTARVGRAIVVLRPNEANIPTIADAFVPRDKTPATKPGRPVVLDIPNAEITTIQVDAEVGVPIDGDVDRVRGAFFLRSDRAVAIDVTEADVGVRQLLPAEIAGPTKFHLRVDLRSNAERLAARQSGERLADRTSLWGDFDGTLGQVPVALTASMEGINVDAKVNLPTIEPGALKGIFPSIPFEARGAGRVNIEGVLPEALRLSGALELEDHGKRATIALTGGIAVDSDSARIVVAADAKGVDPRMFLKEAPEVNVDARAKVALTLVPGEREPRIMVEAATAPTRVLDQDVPAVDAILHLHRGELLVSATIHEPGAPINADVSLLGDRVSFSASVASDDLAEAPRIARFVRGAVRGRVDGTYEGGVVHAKVSATGQRMGTVGAPGSTVSAGGLQVVANVDGPISKLEVRAQGTASGFDAAGERLDSVRVGVNGALLSPKVTVDVQDRQHGHIAAQADLSILGKVVRDVRFKVERDGETASGSVESIEFGKGVTVRAASIREGSIGNLKGNVTIDNGEILGDLHADRLDLARVQKLLALPIPMGGIANIDLHVARTARGRTGHVEIEIERGHLFLVEGISARLSARLEDDKIAASGFVRVVDDATDEQRKAALAVSTKGTAKGTDEADDDAALLCDGPIAQVSFANASATVKGPLLSGASWKAATGSIDVAADHFDLGCIQRRLPPMLRPFDRARGLVTARFRIERDPADPRPSVKDLRVSTVGLGLVGKGGAWESKDLDVALVSSLSGATGDAHASVAVFKQSGVVLMRADASTTLDIDALVEGGAARTRAYREAPFVVQLALPSVPIASLAALPDPVGKAIPAMDGTLKGIVQVAGTLESPRLFASIQAANILPPGEARSDSWVPSVNTNIVASYDPNHDGGRGMVVAKATMSNGAPVATVSAGFVFPASAILDPPKTGPIPWNASVTADIARLPLDIVPTLALADVTGWLKGRVSILDINKAPKVEVDVHTEDLAVQKIPMAIKVTGKIGAPGSQPADKDHPSTDAAEATFKALVTDENGELRLSAVATGTMLWKDNAIPEPDVTRPGEIFIEAKQFRIAAAYPLVAGALTKLDGVLDGSMTVSWDDLKDASRGHIDPSSRFELSNAVAYVPQLGQELHEGHALLYVEAGDGLSQKVVLDGIQAEGSSGRLHGRIEAALSGLSFGGAKGDIIIDEDQPMPVTLEGVSFGKASGEIHFEVEHLVKDVPSKVAGEPPKKKSEIYSKVKISKGVIELPTSSSRNVQSLDDAPTVLTSELLGPPIEKRSQGATELAFDIVVEPTEVKSTTLSVVIKSEKPKDDKGQPRFNEGKEQQGIYVLLSDELHASGDIALASGYVILNFKKFEVDHGLVRLREEDATNPYVNLTAHWDANPELRIFVDYAGLLSPITDQKIHFRSDPPTRSEAEIAQLLIFGESSASATNLVGVGVSTFTGGLLGSLFGSTPLGDHIKISLGASETEQSLGTTFAINERFSLGGGLKATQQSAQSQTPQRTGSCEDLFGEVRFTDRWSGRLATGFCQYDDQSTTESNGGSGISISLDVLWQTRY